MRTGRYLVAVGLIVGLGSLSGLQDAGGQGLGERLHSSRARKQAVQDELRDVKREQASERESYTAAQSVADKARASYNKAKGELEATRKHIRQAREKLDQYTVRLRNHSAVVSDRVRLMYEMGEPSYVEVLLDATSFSDFVERADYMQRVAENDAEQLVEFTREVKAVEGLRDELEATREQEETLARELNAKKAEAESAESAAWAEYRKTTRNRARYEAELAEIEEETEALQSLIAEAAKAARQGGLSYAGPWDGWGSAPIQAPHRMTSPFGMRFHPILKTWKHHAGIDLGCPSGTPIHAAAKGRVVVAGWRNNVLGYAVFIDHGGGWSTIYGHMTRVAASRGQHVNAGDVIGYVGSTGRSTGPHLHFGVARNGTCVDPMGAGAY